jgi:hypothetical protein
LIDYEMIAAREAIAQSGAALLEVQASHVAIYLTILFAYMSVAYVAGKELTRFQLATVTIVFIAAAGREAYLISLFGLAARLKAAQLAEVYEDSPAPSLWLGADNSIFWPVAIWSIGILASLIFMWSIRHSKDE